MPFKNIVVDSGWILVIARGEVSSSFHTTLFFVCFVSVLLSLQICWGSCSNPFPRQLCEALGRSKRHIPWHVTMETAHRRTLSKDLLLWLYRVFLLNLVLWSSCSTVHHTHCAWALWPWAWCCPQPVAGLRCYCHHQTVNSHSPASVKLQRISQFPGL